MQQKIPEANEHVNIRVSVECLNMPACVVYSLGASLPHPFTMPLH